MKNFPLLKQKVHGIRVLNWNHFKGLPEASSPYDACLRWGIFYSYSKFSFHVRVHIGETSWYKPGKETEELLKHEQGHLIITHMFGEKLLRELNGIPKNFKNPEIDNQANILFDKIFKQCEEYQELYDQETNHSLNKTVQKRWNELLDEYFYNHNCHDFNKVFLPTSLANQLL
jgi:hypothetical protein